MAQQQKVREKVYDHVLTSMCQLIFTDDSVLYLTPEFLEPTCEEVLLCFRNSFYVCIAENEEDAELKLDNPNTRFRFMPGERQSFINVSRNLSNLYGKVAGGGYPAIIDKQVYMQYKTAP